MSGVGQRFASMLNDARYAARLEVEMDNGDTHFVFFFTQLEIRGVFFCSIASRFQCLPAVLHVARTRIYDLNLMPLQHDCHHADKMPERIATQRWSSAAYLTVSTDSVQRLSVKEYPSVLIWPLGSAH